MKHLWPWTFYQTTLTFNDPGNIAEKGENAGNQAPKT